MELEIDVTLLFKNSMMKKIPILLFLILSFLLACSNTSTSLVQEERTLSADNFLNGKLYHYVSYYDNEQLKTYLYLTPDGHNSDGQFMYGTYILFSDSLHYEIYNTAPCGNDCFITSLGKYFLFDDDELAFVLDSTVYYGMCGNEPTIYGDGEKLFKIIRTNHDSAIQLLPKLMNDSCLINNSF